MSVNQKDLIRRSKLLAGIYETSKRKIVAELLSFETFTNIEKRRIIKEVDELLKELTLKSDAWYKSNLRTAYKEGSSDVVGYLKRLGVKNMTYTAYDWETISMMVDRSQKFTYEAISGVKRSTSRVLDDLTIKRAQAIIAEGSADQKTLRELKGDLLDFMQKKGVKIKDSAGRNWELDKYAEMLARTDMMNSYNQGVANQILHKGGDLAKITSYPTCKCDVCLAWEGKIVSITGRTPGYPSLDSAYEDGVFHPNCFKKDTEVYTENGWKLFPELKDEKIMSINPVTQEMEWVNYVNKIAYRYKGKMLEFKGNSFDLSVTPDHMMYAGTNSHGKGNKQTIKWQLIEAKEVAKKNHKQLRIPKWKGKDIKSPLEGLSIEQYAFLLGAYLSEGYTDINWKQSQWKVCISQSEKRKGRFRKELLEMGFYENKDKFIITNKQWARHFKKFGGSYEKYIPEFFMEAKPEILKIFLRAFTLGDGSVNESEYKGFTSTNETLFTSSERLAGQLGEVIFKTGRYPSFRKPDKPKMNKFKNGEYMSKHTCWTIRINKSKNSYYNLSPSIAHRGIQLKEVDYDDYVYDVELEKNHILLVRRNGKTAWSGNCKHDLMPVLEEFEQQQENDLTEGLYETQMSGLEGEGWKRR